MKNIIFTKFNNYIDMTKFLHQTVLCMTLIYFSSLILMPIINYAMAIDAKKSIYKKYNTIKTDSFGAVGVKYNNVYALENHNLTYINIGQMVSRQIDNNRFQNFISDSKGSILQLKNSDNSLAQNISYDAYGNIIKQNSFTANQKYSSIQKNNNNLLRTINRDERNIERDVIKLAYDENRRYHKQLTVLNDEINIVKDEVNLLRTENKYKQNKTILNNLQEEINLPNQFMYNGERFDINTGLQYLRARFYAPEIKRFVNQDSYEFLNKFSYVELNPVSNIDSTGHFIEEWIKNPEENVGELSGSGAVAVVGSVLSTIGAYKFGQRAMQWRYNNNVAKKATDLSQQLKNQNFSAQFSNGDSNQIRRANQYDGIVFYQSSHSNTVKYIGTKLFRKINLAPAHGAIGFGMVDENNISRFSNQGVIKKNIEANNLVDKGAGYYKMDFVFRMEAGFGIDFSRYSPKTSKAIYIDYSGARGLNREIAKRAMESLVSNPEQYAALSYGLLSTNCQYYLNKRFLPEYIVQAEQALLALESSPQITS